MQIIAIPKNLNILLEDIMLKIGENKKTRTISFLLSKFKNDKDYRDKVIECIKKDKIKLNNNDRTTVNVLLHDKIELYNISRENNTYMYKLLYCMIKAYLG